MADDSPPCELCGKPEDDCVCDFNALPESRRRKLFESLLADGFIGLVVDDGRCYYTITRAGLEALRDTESQKS